MITFDSPEIPDSLKKALKKLQFEKPTEIQSKTLNIILKGQDLIACSETGSGKTGAFGIPLITHLINNPQESGLILAPTRELVQQITVFLKQLCEFTPIKVVSLVGGMDIRRQFKLLKGRPRLIIATPGRLIDHLERRTVNFKNTTRVVLDEGDRMLDMGFAPQLDHIVEYLPEERQTLLFSATFPKKVQALAKTYLFEPRRISVGEKSKPATLVKQSLHKMKLKEKDDKIIDELNERNGIIIVFAKTQRRTENLAKHLRSYGFQVAVIHGGRSQGQRNQALKNFRSGKSRILCATDVAARGLDVPSVEHVINYDIPMMHEDYIHRIGRTARNGKTGEAVTFVTPEEYYPWSKMMRTVGMKNLMIPEALQKQSKKGSGKKVTKKKTRRFGKKTSGSSQNQSKPGSRKKKKRTSNASNSLSSKKKTAGSRNKKSSSRKKRSTSSNFKKKRSSQKRWS